MAEVVPGLSPNGNVELYRDIVITLRPLKADCQHIFHRPLYSLDSATSGCSSSLCFCTSSGSFAKIVFRSPPQMVYVFFFWKGNSLLLRSVCALQKGNTGCAPTHRGREMVYVLIQLPERG
jgi:hypothetical protein